MPVPLDEYPVHQTPLSMKYVGTSDRNFYDRCYFNAHDRTGEIFLITGAGVYPQLGVKDAYAVVRRGSDQHVIRVSDALDDERLNLSVGPYRVEVIEPLQRVRLICDADSAGIGFDLTWTGSFPAIDEDHHILRQGVRPIIEASRFAQLGSWEGELRVAGETIEVDPDVWVGSRDRSWGIRPIGDPEPAGKPFEGSEDWGLYWLYIPVRFDDYSIMVIVQEDGLGHRTLNDAVRILPDGRVEQLGWPRVRITYQSGTRIPEHARVELTERDGTPVLLEVDSLLGVPLHVGCGYGGDPDWTHGQWRGPDWLEGATYDFTDPEVAARTPWGVVDHVGRATCNGDLGWGLFEHGTIGKHLPSGFTDIGSVAP
ncbi:MAG TPA: hypothetical protein VMH41_15210 [Mycobacteriales bacterium]|nr:hypothetical protein [Mycobacteriales bacterium]